MPLRETRRILLDGNITDVVRDGDQLVAGDGRRVGVQDAVHLAPVVPSKIICVHLNYSSRVEEMMVSLPPTRSGCSGSKLVIMLESWIPCGSSTDSGPRRGLGTI